MVILGQHRYFMLNVLRTIDNAIASIRQVLVMYDYRTLRHKKRPLSVTTPIRVFIQQEKGLNLLFSIRLRINFYIARVA